MAVIVPNWHFGTVNSKKPPEFPLTAW